MTNMLKKLFNWSEVHFYRSNFLQNPYFKNIPEQLKILGFNTLAALIGTTDLTNALQTPGPFTVFAPTDEAFEKFIGM